MEREQACDQDNDCLPIDDATVSENRMWLAELSTAVNTRHEDQKMVTRQIIPCCVQEEKPDFRPRSLMASARVARTGHSGDGSHPSLFTTSDELG